MIMRLSLTVRRGSRARPEADPAPGRRPAGADPPARRTPHVPAALDRYSMRASCDLADSVADAGRCRRRPRVELLLALPCEIFDLLLKNRRETGEATPSEQADTVERPGVAQPAHGVVQLVDQLAVSSGILREQPLRCDDFTVHCSGSVRRTWSNFKDR